MPYQLHPRTLLTLIEPEGVLLNPDTGDSYVLNPMSVQIYSLLEQGLDMKSIIAKLSRDFPQAQERIPADVEEFIAQLLAEGLLLSTDGHD